ncbi:MAG: hypothetical protein LBR56_02350, partial [Sporomusaceae bacterium]|nr:hypothetical protein [Sporomusaceae bacterium]
ILIAPTIAVSFFIRLKYYRQWARFYVTYVALFIFLALSFLWAALFLRMMFDLPYWSSWVKGFLVIFTFLSMTAISVGVNSIGFYGFMMIIYHIRIFFIRLWSTNWRERLKI